MGTSQSSSSPFAAPTAFASGASLRELAADEREGRLGRRRAQVGGDRLHVGRLPGLDALDEHQPAAAAEQTERVAVATASSPERSLACVELDRLRRKARAQPPTARSTFGRSLPAIR